MAQVSVELVGFPEEQREEVIRRLARISRRDEASIRQMLEDGGGGCRIAEATDRTIAQQVRNYLEPLGVELRIEPVERSAQPAAGAAEPAATPPPPEPEAPPRQTASAGPGGEAPRALAFGQRLRWGLELCGRNFWSVVGLVLLMVAVVMVLPLGMAVLGGAQMQALAGSPTGAPPNPAAMMTQLLNPATLTTFALLAVAMLLVLFWFQAALFRLPADSLVSGERTPVFATLKSVFARTPEFITALGLVFLIQIAVQLLAGIGMALGGALGGAAAVAVNIAVFVFLVWVMLSLLLVAPVVLFEEIGPFAAIGRAWRLVSGLRWRMLGNLVLLGLVMAGVMLLGALLGRELQQAGGAVAGVGGLVMLLFVLALEFVFLFLFIFFAESFYFEARVRKEGWRPGWLEPLEPSWALSERPEEPAHGRGLRAWLELIGITVLGLLLLGGLASLVPSNMPMPQAPAFQPGGRMQQAPGEYAPSGSRVAPAPTGQTRLQLSVGTFFEDEKPHLWLETGLTGVAGLPEGIALGELLEIEIDRVTGPGGRDLYARDSRLEGPFFWKVRLERGRDGTLNGRRDVHLQAGSEEADIRDVRGTARLAVPV
ncbi:MAG TPA: hypothetical protein VKA64_06230, partial [Gammaproteobacteria bacterium]|nr:hypothetical protein [Gammaproteobacteria bacterium]